MIKRICLVALLMPISVVAAPVAINTSVIDNPNKEARFGIGGTRSVAQRPFVGVDDQSTSLPYISFKYDDFYIEGVDIGYTLVSNKHYKFDILATPRFYERKESFASGGELQGIGETKQTYFGGVSAQFNIEPVTLTVQLLRDLLESDGIEAAATVSKGFSLTKTFSLIPAIGVTWQDSELVDHFYGVSANEVQAGRPLYEGASSLNYNASLTASWDISQHIQLLGLIKYEIFDDGITNSSIVDEDAILQSAIGAVYRF